MVVYTSGSANAISATLFVTACHTACNVTKWPKIAIITRSTLSRCKVTCLITTISTTTVLTRASIVTGVLAFSTLARAGVACFTLANTVLKTFSRPSIARVIDTPTTALDVAIYAIHVCQCTLNASSILMATAASACTFFVTCRAIVSRATSFARPFVHVTAAYTITRTRKATVWTIHSCLTCRTSFFLRESCAF